ncbi:MAG TPA: hypothetical protein VKH45_06410 [Candidatus Acidoferrum sp.]|nr:hypothetical protein [Candidatus Acidoferrum sp.]
MLSPARLTQLMMEVVFILLGALVVWLGANGRIYFDRRGIAMLVLSVALVAWGLLAFAKPVPRWASWEKWNRGVSLVLLGMILFAITRVPFPWVPTLLIVVGFILITRGLFAALMIFRQS